MLDYIIYMCMYIAMCYTASSTACMCMCDGTSSKIIQLEQGVLHRKMQPPKIPRSSTLYAAREKGISIGALEHSIFAYFFLKYMETHKCRGRFAVKQAMQEITKLCFSFSSLLVFYDHEKGNLRLCEIHPTMSRLIDVEEDNRGIDEIDFGRFEMFGTLFTHEKVEQKSRPLPHLEVVGILVLLTLKSM